MLYFDNVFEFDKVVDLIASLCGSAIGKKYAKNLSPSSDREKIEHLLDETEEIIKFLIADFSSLPDIENILSKIHRNYTLEAIELKQVLELILFSKDIKSIHSINEDFPILLKYKQSLFYSKKIECIIEKVLDENGEIKDDATKELLKIRLKIRQLEKIILKKLSNIINSKSNAQIIQEKIITIRNSRYVIPVKAEYIKEFPSIIQDRSSSGETYFVEPISLLAENNRLLEERLKEKKEVERILKNITSELNQDINNLYALINLLGEIDFIQAKGILCKMWNCERPKVVDEKKVKIIGGRHPFIGKEAIPVDIELNEERNCIILSGPNAGGKTVALKMVGLFQIMVQSGLFITSSEKTELGIMNKIFGIIGDNQSIENGLSSFTSHILSLNKIINNFDEKSLILIDEICSGTSPEEGSAIAGGVLKFFQSKSPLILVTTHLSSLKFLAGNIAGIENACVKFNEETHFPEYKILVGLPGKSYAFEIAEKIGINKKVLEYAEGFLKEEERLANKFLFQIQLIKNQIEEEKLKLEEQIDKIKREKSDLLESMEKTRRKREEIITNAYLEAKSIVFEAEKRISEIIMNLSSNTNFPRISEAKREIKKLESKFVFPQSNRIEREDVKVGLQVKFLGCEKPAKIISEVDNKNNVEVQIGNLKIKTDIKNLSLYPSKEGLALREKANDVKNPKHTVKSLESLKAKEEIDIRGVRAGEVSSILEKEFDKLVYERVREVKIIHGIGTGALIKATHDFLKNCFLVECFRNGNSAEGGIGVTIVELKQ